MSYQQSNFDPNAYDAPGQPLRPYNAVQWAGFVLGVVGIALVAAYFAGRAGWIPHWIDSPIYGLMPCVLGSVLVNSRRGPPVPMDEAQRARDRRTLFITLGISAAIFGVIIAIEFSGA
jgi:hypothetical protein